MQMYTLHIQDGIEYLKFIWQRTFLPIAPCGDWDSAERALRNADLGP